MATKRKQQTVQFLFEASSENDITRCVISTSSGTLAEKNKERTVCLSPSSEGLIIDKDINCDKRNDQLIQKKSV